MEKKLTRSKAFLLSCVFSVLLFMATFWSAAFQDTTPYWVESIGFFMLTYICIDQFSKKNSDINPWMIGLAIIVGQLLFHIPIRIGDFMGGIGSIMIVVSCIIAVLLAVLCYIDKKPFVFILSYVVLTLFNSFVADMWDKYVSGI